ncbi:MAG: hypothetical protein LBN11_02320 [Tannerella sp.]|jgi:hypothetical protein|nr:hypothetical protein [Tannerella sp.]
MNYEFSALRHYKVRSNPVIHKCFTLFYYLVRTTKKGDVARHVFRNVSDKQLSDKQITDLLTTGKTGIMPLLLFRTLSERDLFPST